MNKSELEKFLNTCINGDSCFGCILDKQTCPLTKLKELKNKFENGYLIEYKHKIGDIVYVITFENLFDEFHSTPDKHIFIPVAYINKLKIQAVIKKDNRQKSYLSKWGTFGFQDKDIYETKEEAYNALKTPKEMIKDLEIIEMEDDDCMVMGKLK
jgi:hypothetical protein